MQQQLMEILVCPMCKEDLELNVEKKEGDEITTDEPLLEVSTDKVDTEIPAPATGVLLRILAHEDEVVAVGAELAVIGEANEAPLRSSSDTDGESASAPSPVMTAPDSTTLVTNASTAAFSLSGSFSRMVAVNGI